MGELCAEHDAAYGASLEESRWQYWTDMHEFDKADRAFADWIQRIEAEERNHGKVDDKTKG